MIPMDVLRKANGMDLDQELKRNMKDMLKYKYGKYVVMVLSLVLVFNAPSDNIMFYAMVAGVALLNLGMVTIQLSSIRQINILITIDQLSRELSENAKRTIKEVNNAIEECEIALNTASNDFEKFKMLTDIQELNKSKMAASVMLNIYEITKFTEFTKDDIERIKKAVSYEVPKIKRMGV